MISIVALAIGVGVLVALAAVSIAVSERGRKGRKHRRPGAMMPVGEEWDL